MGSIGSLNTASSSSDHASRQLTVKLQQLAAEGDPEGAMELFNLAAAHDAVNVYHWNLIQNLGFTESSAGIHHGLSPYSTSCSHVKPVVGVRFCAFGGCFVLSVTNTPRHIH